MDTSQIIAIDYSFAEITIFDGKQETNMRLSAEMDGASVAQIKDYLRALVQQGEFDTAIAILQECEKGEIPGVLKYLRLSPSEQEQDPEKEAQIELLLGQAYQNFLAGAKSTPVVSEMIKDYFKRASAVVCSIPRVYEALTRVVGVDEMFKLEPKLKDIETLAWAKDKDFRAMWRDYQTRHQEDDTSFSSARQVYEIYQDVEAGFFEDIARKTSRLSYKPALRFALNGLPENVMGHSVRSAVKERLGVADNTLHEILKELSKEED